MPPKSPKRYGAVTHTCLAISGIGLGPINSPVYRNEHNVFRVDQHRRIDAASWVSAMHHRRHTRRFHAVALSSFQTSSTAAIRKNGDVHQVRSSLANQTLSCFTLSTKLGAASWITYIIHEILVTVSSSSQMTAAPVTPRPEWFAAFLADRGTRKPSSHTVKAGGRSIHPSLEIPHR
jgi:hypothetical protein